MNTSFTFVSSARSISGRKGIAESHGVEPAIPFSAPPEFQGEAGIWTPEHFFLSAIASCFVATFEAIARVSDFQFSALSVVAEGIVEKVDGRLNFRR